MKAKASVFLIAVLCICLSGCADDVPQNKAKNHEASQGKFYSNPIVLTRLREEMTIDEKGEQTLEVIDSWEDWTELSKQIVEEDSDYVNYDKEFFKKKDLLFVGLIAECDNRYAFDKMDLKEGQQNKKLTISMTEKTKVSPDYYQDSLLVLHKTGLLVEVDKGSVPEDVIWHLSMQEGTYNWKCGFVTGMKQSDGDQILEFDEAQWPEGEAQQEHRQLVSMGEPVQLYAIGERVRYVASASGIESYNQSHKEKLEATALMEGGFMLDEKDFMKYIAYLNETDDGQHTGFGVAIDDEEVVLVEEINISKP